MTLRSLQAVPDLPEDSPEAVRSEEPTPAAGTSVLAQAARPVSLVDLDHEVVDLSTRTRRPCPLPGGHAVAAVPGLDYVTCRNPLPLALRRASRSITCNAQVLLGEDGQLPGLCPRCRGVLDPARVIGAR